MIAYHEYLGPNELEQGYQPQAQSPIKLKVQEFVIQTLIEYELGIREQSTY